MKIIMSLVLFGCILFMSIGYSALNSELSISGEAVVLAEGDIQITNITVLSAETGAFLTYNPSFTNDSSNIGVTLPSQESKITLLIEVTNNTNNYYHLDQIIEIDNNNNINYEIKDKDIIYFPEQSITEIEITFSYKDLINSNIEITLNMDYVFEKTTYKKLEYLTFSGNEYIDTGILNTGDYIFETEYMQTAYTANDGGWIFNGRAHYSYSLGVFSGKSGIFNGYGAATYSSQPTSVFNVWYTLYYSRFEFFINDVSRTVVGKKLIPETYERTILIAGATVNYNATQDVRHFRGNIKCFKVTDAVTGNVLKHFVPAEITEGVNAGEIGYWDVVNDQFYTNSGTGNITGA